MNELRTIIYRCASCGEENETVIDPSGGARQSYTEDCTVCCRPNLLTIIFDRNSLLVSVKFEE